MRKTLVTGGAGFIGSHLCKKLLEADKKVICLDNMFTGTYDNISELYSNPNFEFIARSAANDSKVPTQMLFIHYSLMLMRYII